MAEGKVAIIVYLPESYADQLRRLAEAGYTSVSAAGRKYLILALDQLGLDQPE